MIPETRRDTRNERTSLRARSIPTRYQLPLRKTSAKGSTSRTPAFPCAERYRNRTARRRASASAMEPRWGPDESTPGVAVRSAMAVSTLVSVPEEIF